MSFNMTFWLLRLIPLAFILHVAYCDCEPSFYAKNIKYEEAIEIDFYYTGINLTSAKACAAFCAQREFCRSAVYNPRTKTCGISYEYTVACASTNERFKHFEEPMSNPGDLVQIACIDQCDKNIDLDKSKSEKVPVGIITGEPNDGKQIKLNDEKRARADGYVTHLTLANISGLPQESIGSAELLALPQKDSQVRKHRKDKGKSQICYRTIRHRFLLGANFEEHDVPSINECRCLCAATYRANHGMYKCHSFQYRNGKCTLNKGNHLGRYDLIDQRRTVYQYIDCDINVLLDVASKFCPKFRETKIIATSTEKPKTTTKAAVKKVELVTAATVEEKKKVGKQAINRAHHPKLNRGKGKKQETKKEKKEEVKQTTTTPSTTTSTESTTTTSSTTTTPETTPSTTTESTSTTTVESTTTAEDNEILDKDGNQMNIKNDGCFEVINDYLMVSVAGGLEHDVSIEECQCMCANSKKSGRYQFQCTSATYYHIERDCILNLEDRVMKPNLFEKQIVNFNVSYIGMTCPLSATLEDIKELTVGGCKRAESSETTTTTTTSPPLVKSSKKKNGANSDECYVELNDFVLEGTAVAVETAVSPMECKCKCAQGEKLYGEECASFLYYYDSNTCLINKQNRFSNPEKFNFVPSVNQSRSYFEWTCANKDAARVKYLSDVCSTKMEPVDGNLLSSEGQTVEVKHDEKTNPVVDGVKRLIEKEFLKKLDAVEKKSMESDVHMKAMGEKELLKKIEKADLELERRATSTEEPSTTEEPTTTESSTTEKSTTTEPSTTEEPTTTEKPSTTHEPQTTQKLSTTEEPTTTEEYTTTKKPTVTEKSTTKKTQKTTKSTPVKTTKKPDTKTIGLKQVPEETIMKRIEEAEKKLETTTTIPVFIMTEPTIATTTTAKLILNKKKTSNKKAKVEKKSNEVSKDKVELKIVDQKLLEKLENTEVKESDEPSTLEKEVVKKSESETIPEGEEEEEEEIDDSDKDKKYKIPEAEGMEDDLDEKVNPQDTPISSTSPPKPKNEDAHKPKAGGVKTHKFDEKIDKEGLPLPRITTTTEASTTTIGYPPAGRCSYSALYQTTFLGRRMLKTVKVKSPADCFAACYALRCRSANLVAQGQLHNCELFRDSLIDYRRPDMIGYDPSTVYFDGINCDGAQ